MKLRQAKKVLNVMRTRPIYRMTTFLKAGERYAKWYKKYT